MKVIKRLAISGNDTEFSDINLMLELNACGRGFITAITDQNCVGKLIRVDVGYHNLILRWFTGFVERAQPAENGSQRLFVRELAGIFERDWPCSLQHPTLKTLAAWLTEKSGMKVILPDAAGYIDKPIPNFTHSGPGYQLLANIGRAFSIDDYIWQPLPDGGIYIGSWSDSMFANNSAEIPPEFATAASGGTTITIPVVQSIRPGLVVNNQRITRVELKNDDLTLTWTPLNSVTGKPLQKSPAQRQIDNAYPELAAGLHLPKFARVMAPSESTALGQKSDPFRPGYAVDVQLLDENGKPAKNTGQFKSVPLPVPMAGSEGGMFNFPQEGTMVELAFTEGRPDKPFVRGTVSEGNNLPAVKPGEQLQQQRAGVSQRVTVAGDWEKETDQAIKEKSAVREVIADQETKTVTERKTIVQATDTTTVLGTAKLMAGAIQQIAIGDYTIGTTANFLLNAVKVDVEAAAAINIKCAALTETIAGIRKSVAASQQLMAPSVWLGSEEINVTKLMLETLDVVKQLAELTASHSHSNTGAPLNAGAIQRTGTTADGLKSKYSPIIA